MLVRILLPDNFFCIDAARKFLQLLIRQDTMPYGLVNVLSLLWAVVVGGTVLGPRPGIGNVTLHWRTQTVDHFAFDSEPSTFQQRMFTYDRYWRRGPGGDGPIWFYCGNEANVELYVNATGRYYKLYIAPFNRVLTRRFDVGECPRNRRIAHLR